MITSKNEHAPSYNSPKKESTILVDLFIEVHILVY